MGFEPAIPASELPQTYASDREATVFGLLPLYHAVHTSKTGRLTTVTAIRMQSRTIWQRLCHVSSVSVWSTMSDRLVLAVVT
jgi:hypothetical protein